MNARSRAAAYTRSLRAGSCGGGVPRPRKSARSRPRKRASWRHQETSDSDSSGVQPEAPRSLRSAASITRSRGGSELSIARPVPSLLPEKFLYVRRRSGCAKPSAQAAVVTTTPPEQSPGDLRSVATKPSRLLPVCSERTPGVKQRIRAARFGARLSDTGRVSPPTRTSAAS